MVPFPEGKGEPTPETEQIFIEEGKCACFRNHHSDHSSRPTSQFWKGFLCKVSNPFIQRILRFLRSEVLVYVLTKGSTAGNRLSRASAVKNNFAGEIGIV